MPNKKALKSVRSSFDRTRLTATINLLLIAHLLEDMGCALRHPGERRRWSHIGHEIDHLPLAVKTGVAHFGVTLLVVAALVGEEAHHYPTLMALGIASYVATYCLVTIASRPAKPHHPRMRAHWVGENVITQPGRK